MLKLTRHLFSWDPNAEYADYYERALYNHILASQNPTTGMMVYSCSVCPGAVKNYCTPENSFWCCTGTGIENHAKYGESIYFHQGSTTLFVNLFIASELNWPSCGLKLRQETTVSGGRQHPVGLHLPAARETQCKHSPPLLGRVGIRDPGEREAPTGAGPPGSYALLTRTWRSGDVVEIAMPFSLRTEGFRDNPRRLAFLFGPLVLCAETRNEPSKFKPPYPAAVAEPGRLLSLLRAVPGRSSTFVASSAVLRLQGKKEREGGHAGAVLQGSRSTAIRDLLEPAAPAARAREVSAQPGPHR